PSASVMAARLVPMRTTVAPARGSPVALSTTTPRTAPGAAVPGAGAGAGTPSVGTVDAPGGTGVLGAPGACWARAVDMRRSQGVMHTSTRLAWATLRIMGTDSITPCPSHDSGMRAVVPVVPLLHRGSPQRRAPG